MIFKTGYKLRRQIGKALQRRSEAIRNALNRYNVQAAKLTPPRPPLSWKEIVDYSFLAEFDLLRHSREDIRHQPWVQVARREATVKYFKLCRAQEEVVRLNIEIRRLRTSIHDETAHTTQVISDLSLSNPPLATELRKRWQLRNSVNLLHIQHMNAVEDSTSFTGLRGIGKRLGFERENNSGSGTVGVDEVRMADVDEVRMVDVDEVRMADVDQQISGQDIPGNEEEHEDGDHMLAQITEFVMSITD